MNQRELETILRGHKHWLKADCDNWEYMRADLCEANLSGANLCGVDLSEANLNLVNLYSADLSKAKLCRADLSKANLIEAHLFGADLSGADLSGANLHKANLCEANLSGANLHKADLSGADLIRANLIGANLRGAELYKADLKEANLNETINMPIIPYACPDTGSFIGWKKANRKIVCLEIPEDAKRSSATGRKCRCNKAKVLSITNLDGSPCELTEVSSNVDEKFIYKVGEVVSVDDFDDNRWHECAPGIHFFINRHEAVAYP